MSAAVLAMGWLERVERDIVHFVTCTLHSDTLGEVLSAAQNKLVPVLLLVGILAVVARVDRRLALHALLAAGAAWGASMLLADVMWATIDRARPTQAYEVILRSDEELSTCASHPEALALRGHGSTSPSFPSRHGMTVGVFTTILWLARRWAGLLALAYGLVVAVGRVYVGKHWPSDILVGVALGVAMAWLWWRLVPRILPRLRPPDPPATHPPGASAQPG